VILCHEICASRGEHIIKRAITRAANPTTDANHAIRVLRVAVVERAAAVSGALIDS
jgi:hypothetical protein